MTPEMIQILRQAAADPEGQVFIERPTQGGWPASLGFYRRLEKEQHLMRVVVRVSAGTGTVTAVYQITDSGRRVLAREDATPGPAAPAARRSRPGPRSTP